MSTIHLLVVGKLKDNHIQVLENDYLKRLKEVELKIHELKSHKEDLHKEASEVIKKLNTLGISSPILLTEKGEEFDSPAFSSWLFTRLDNQKDLGFVIGGAAGFDENLKKMAQSQISLGRLTYPHRLARLLFIEQVYRAQTIYKNHPYHK